MDWVIGPGRIIETDGIAEADGFFNRVQGVGSVQPFGDHIDRISKALFEAASIPDIARGSVDVSIAESGIARALQLAPLISKAEDSELVITEVLSQMFYDLANGWLPAYEQITLDGVTVAPTFGDKLPVDRTAKFQELNDMLLNGVISTEFYRSEATKLGYTFPANITEQIKKDQEASAALADPFGARLDEEGGDSGQDPSAA